MRLSTLGIIVFVAFCGLIFALVVSMPEPVLFSFLISPMVIPRGSVLVDRAYKILTVEEQPATMQSIPIEQ